MSTALVWLRRDLRLEDNPALARAAERHDSVIPVYIHAPEELAPWQPGAASRWWLHRALDALNRGLRGRRSRLTLRRGPSLDALRALVDETGARAVYWNRQYEPAAVARDRAVKAALKQDGLQVESANSALLWEPWQVSTQDGKPYRVFTPFWKACDKSSVATPLPAPKPLPGSKDWPDSLTLSALGLLPKIDWYRGMDEVWQPSEDGAQRRLEQVRERIVPDYADTRNLPAVDGVSMLSPYLHHGQLSPRQVWHAVAGRFDGAPLRDVSAEAFLRELGWREFAHHALYHFPDLTDAPVQKKFADFDWIDGDERDRRLRAWRRGRTGVPLVDAGMRQLWHSGWMHNRVRMVVASFLTKNCRVHWLDGARWFWDTLVDADLASNSLGWQWVAGSGFDAAPYFRVFNPVRQSERYDPDGDYIARWVPELAGLDKKTRRQPWTRAGEPPAGYPRPLVDLAASRRAALDAYQRLG